MRINYIFQQYLSGILIYLLLIVLADCQNNAGNRTPEKALSTFELPPEFQIELVAAEPLISDPVDMEIDEDGRMYVVEMHGYPLDNSGSGKIKLLSDTDGDGSMDTSTVFADSLILPTGIMRWKEGIIVTDAPDVLYLEDSDEDGKADIRKVVLTGFALSNPQHNLNSPMYGLDNWIYLANEGIVSTTLYEEEFGDQGNEVLFPGQPDSPRLPVNAGGLNVRFRPDSFELENLASTTQFGHTFDAWGHHLQVSNSNHIYQEVIAARYLNRNPDLLISDATQSLSDHGNAAEVYPITKNPEYQLLTDVGVFTSASGLTAYLGGAFPSEYNENTTFVTESVSNLVHADRLKPDGTSFTAGRITEDKEFLASTDSWFRPVNLYTGPDGALYVVDYYRQIIEHPEWMSEDVVNSGNLYNGVDKGRIYRISAVDAESADRSITLGLKDATIEQLVKWLADPNIWWRRNAQRLLVDRNDDSAVPQLTQMTQNPASPFGRIHALWTLEGMGQLSTDLISNALKDPNPGIRENGIKLAELHLKADSTLISSLLELRDDENLRVRFQLLCTLGYVDSPDANNVRRQLLFKDFDDRWVQTAALTAKSLQNEKLLESVIDRFDPENPAYSSFLERLTSMYVVSENKTDLDVLLKRAADLETQEEWQAPLMKGIAAALRSGRVSSSRLEDNEILLVNTFFEHSSNAVREAALELLEIIGPSKSVKEQNVIDRAKEIARSAHFSEERRALALRFLGLLTPSQFTDFLQERIAPGEPPSVQLAALNTLSMIPDETVSQFVLDRWSNLTPHIRNAALGTFMVSRDRVTLLLDAIEEGTIQAGAISRSQEISLMAGRWPRATDQMSETDLRLRDRARSLLTESEGARDEVVKEYLSTLELEGNWKRGKAIFQEQCAICHMRGEQIGMEFGPDLASIRNREPAAIMRDILDPQMSIADGYDLWSVDLHNGESLQGIISSETPTAITLSYQGGQETTIARENIKNLHELGVSAMPPGLENQISQQEMADLLSYLKGRLE